MTTVAITLQIVLLFYHQTTTLCDFFPFNGARFYSLREKLAEAGVNLILMSLAPVGFIFDLPSLKYFGVVYYFILLAIEFATWWGPYFLGPSVKGLEVYNRIHRRTITVVPRRGENPAPNLEHLILMGLTAAAGLATLKAYHSMPDAHAGHWVGVLVVALLLVSGTLYQFCFQGRAKAKFSGPSVV
jgi:hypothetical protein